MPNAAMARRLARVTGALWLAVFVSGSLALFPGASDLATIAVAAASICYLGVCAGLFLLLRSIGPSLALTGALCGVFGSLSGLLGMPSWAPVPALVWFGLHCGANGILIARSGFLPRWIGYLLIFAAVGWLTFASPELARSLHPLNLVPGMLGEGAALLWLLFKGIDAHRWPSPSTHAMVTS